MPRSLPVRVLAASLAVALGSGWVVPAAALAADAPRTGPGPAARKADAPAAGPTPVVAARAVRDAVARRDPATLADLAARESPDPWLVVDVLLATGAAAEAASFAAARTGLGASALRDYVTARRTEKDDVALRKQVDASLAATAAEAPPTEVLAPLNALREAPLTVVGVLALTQRATALAALGRPQAALDAFTAASGHAERLGWTRVLRLSLTQAGVAAADLEDYRLALSLFQRRLAVDDGTTEPLAQAALLGHVGTAELALGRVDEARAHFERAVALARGSADRPAHARALAQLGTFHQRTGDLPRAVRLHREALEEMRSAGDRVGAARALGHLAIVQAQLGALGKALDLGEKALAEFETLRRVDEAAGVLTTLASLHVRMGRPARAIPMLERALAMHRRLDRRASALGVLVSLAELKCLECEGDEGIRLLGDAIAEAEALGVPDLLGRAFTVRAASYEANDLLDEAVEDRKRAVIAFESAKNRAAAIGASIALGDLLLRTHELVEAGRIADRAVRDAERLRADGRLVDALTLKARVRLAQHDPGAALEIARQAVRTVDRLVMGLGGEQAAGVRESMAAVYDVGLRAAAREGDAAEVTWFVECGRAGALMEALWMREEAQRASLPEELRVMRDAARAAEAAAAEAHAVALTADDLRAARRAAEVLDEARNRSVEVAESIERATKRGDAWDHRGATLEEVQERLGPGQAYVAFALPRPDAVAVVATSTSARVVKLAAADEIVAACEALHAFDPDEDATEALARLEALLVQPLALGTDITTVLVSPEGPICYVPLTALLRGRNVAFIPSATTWIHLQEQRQEPGVKVLAVGDPDYSVASTSKGAEVYAGNGGATKVAPDGARPAVGAAIPALGTRGPSRLISLPQTRFEVETVGDVRLLGGDGSETALRRALASATRWKAVHIACHGLVDRDEPLLSALALTPTAEDDGFLTAFEVLGLSVPADLVVLSACETGKGRVRRGEGLSGLMRSFLFAGSPRVVCSLWKVDDEATRALMVRFYELWNPRVAAAGAPTGRVFTAAEALRAAQEHVRAQPKWRHPYYWAAWLLWGLP